MIDKFDEGDVDSFEDDIINEHLSVSGWKVINHQIDACVDIFSKWTLRTVADVALTASIRSTMDGIAGDLEIFDRFKYNMHEMVSEMSRKMIGSAVTQVVLEVKHVARRRSMYMEKKKEEEALSSNDRLNSRWETLKSDVAKIVISNLNVICRQLISKEIPKELMNEGRKLSDEKIYNIISFDAGEVKRRYNESLDRKKELESIIKEFESLLNEHKRL